MTKEVDRYTYRVTWSEDDSEYVGLCAELPSLSWLEQSPEKALLGIRKLVKETVTDLKRGKEPVPEPISTRSYSGKFMVRVPPEVHRMLAIKAAESGVSINRLVSSKLS
ncbi:MAG TPA: type II toxin-antitoxin system HicB family antitoxin [Woeseiaceae bacterium]|nr:type II toxin-antitoxin system HicB family antitoxin [Woeseiaceae bacterium]